ncbi:hypothetical protein CDD80_925 [Ophiocordyceps camponoti-rufipedis]|uniref:Translation initiation factor eIF2B subunit delta n=1 Tax=Ophiocordyceps camponoti-rufipedis TaxID=2004952 RepID=A0A2C5ZD34_9HYPO|nr:hypothetical protein CDD80_925 [Ophiocordyceps camponoti-rufipedis]
MAGESVPPAGDDKKRKKEQPQTESNANDKKLSNAELKKKAKEDKAARRAAAKATQPASSAPAPSQQQTANESKNGAGPARGTAAASARPKHHHDGGARSTANKTSKVPECFSHLSMARRLTLTQADKEVHPAVLALGQYMACFAIGDSITRVEATLLALKKVIDAYTTPLGATLSRHFTSHVLNPQIEYLAACRPMCFSMGNAIRWLKLQISKLDIDLPDSDAKKHLCALIDSFISERITLANFVMVNTAAEMVADGDVIVVYARHHLVERALIRAHSVLARHFRVIVVDDPFDRVGLGTAKALASAGLPVTYVSDLGALPTTLAAATLVMAAAEAMFANGAMYARAGTCDVVTVASHLGLRVVALCESINFTERVAIDSLTYNEIDPESCDAEGFRLLFDTTMQRYISVVVTELGTTSAKSVTAILRKLEEL